ncbi:MAG: helix-hairpin-helix domain-containing protein [Bacteroidota bacterium]|jgi:hypothetical protein|nr:MAG: hypothetical protein DIU61_14975 [Bacteroidota bacterium]
MKVTLIFCILMVPVMAVHAQQDAHLQQLIDDIAAIPDIDVPYEALYENLAQIFSEPYDLNRVTAEELRLLGFLSVQQIDALIKHRESFGDFLSPYELQSVEGLDEVTVDRLLPFVRVYEPETRLDKSVLKRIAENRNAYVMISQGRVLQRRAGDDSTFLGSPDQLKIRFRSSRPGDFSLGFTLEKDAGEPFVFESLWRPGFDHLSFHVQLQNKGIIENLVVGDYQVQAGQGLLLGGLFGLGKSGSETVNTLRRANVGGVPFSSSNENSALRGAVVTIRFDQNLHVTGFYSDAPRDALVEGDSTDSQLATALRTSGLHRTENEIAGRAAIREINAGVVVNRKTARMDAGVVLNSVIFDTPVQRKPRPYNQFAFSGSENHSESVFLNYNHRNHAFFSEFALNATGGTAAVIGLLSSLTPQLEVAAAYRDYSRDFHAFYANAISEGSSVQNEKGIYWGWKYRLTKYLHVTGYFDMFMFPWLRYRVYAPSRGYEWLLRIARNSRSGPSWHIQFREECKARNIYGDDPLVDVVPGVKRNVLAGTSIAAARGLTLKTRLQYSAYQIGGQTTEGMALMQDIAAEFGKLRVAARYALFDTDDYDNRQYAYERDAWLSFSLPAYYGVGTRSYILVSYSFKRMTLWMRFAHTRYIDREEIGSGPDKIAGNQRNDVKLQLRYRF